MKLLAITALSLFSLTAFSTDNLSDNLDENKVPQNMEERANEPINTSDPVDKNFVPASEEERQEEENLDIYDSDALDKDAVDDEIR